MKKKRRITITERGRDVARVIPIEPEPGFDERLVELEAAGSVTPAPPGSPLDIRPVASIPGALRRFLESRD